MQAYFMQFSSRILLFDTTIIDGRFLLAGWYVRGMLGMLGMLGMTPNPERK